MCPFEGFDNRLPRRLTAFGSFHIKNISFNLDGKVRRLIFHVLKFAALLSVTRKKKTERNSVEISLAFKKRSQRDH
jgi:hypothetical protein